MAIGNGAFEARLQLCVRIPRQEQEIVLDSNFNFVSMRRLPGPPKKVDCRSQTSRYLRRGNRVLRQTCLKRLQDQNLAILPLGGEAVLKLLNALDDHDSEVRRASVDDLGGLGDEDAVPPLKAKLDDADGKTRQAAVKALVRTRDRAMEKTLLSRELDQADPWIDPKVSITETRLPRAAKRLGSTRDKVYSLYAPMAADFHLQFE
jgi:hypothetical protein